MSTAATSPIVPDSSTRHTNAWSCHRFQTITSNTPARLPVISKHKDKFAFPRSHKPLRSFNVKDVVVYSSALPDLQQIPSDPSPEPRKFWILGMLLSVILPFWRNKWGPFQILKNKVEAAMDTAEHVAEVVEDVAEEVEKVTEEIASHLPQGGKLQEAVTFVENVAKETAKHAHLADEFIEKVEDLEQDVEDFIDPSNNQTDGEAKE